MPCGPLERRVSILLKEGKNPLLPPARTGRRSCGAAQQPSWLLPLAGPTVALGGIEREVCFQVSSVQVSGVSRWFGRLGMSLDAFHRTSAPWNTGNVN